MAGGLGGAGKAHLFVLLIACLTNLVLIADRSSFSVLLKPLAEEFGASRAAVAGIFSLMMIVYAFSSPLAGHLSDRCGFRRVVLAGTLIASAGMLLSSLARSLAVLYFSFAFIFGAGSATFYAVPLAEIRRWFGARSGMVLGIISCVGALGSWLGPPLTAWLVQIAGWQFAFLLLGGLGFILLFLPLCFLRLGEEGTGTREQDKEGEGASLSFQEALRTLQFWLLSASYASFGTAQFIVTVHTVAYATDQGIGNIEAAFVVGMLGALGIPGRLAIGWWVDRRGRREPLAILGFVQTVALLFLLPLRHVWQLWAFVCIFGFCYGGMLSQFVGLLGDCFGPCALASIYGLQTFFVGIAAAFGSWFGGHIFDVTGSYYGAYAFALLCELVSVLTLLGGTKKPLLSKRLA